MKSGVILAGGKSSRMGIDKCTLLFCGKPLIYWPYSVLSELVDEMVISVSLDKDLDPLKRLLGVDIKVAEDEKKDLGPLSGIYSSFKKAEGEYVAVTPCDSPLIKSELYQKLFEVAKESEGAVPIVRGYPEPLHGVYKRKAMLNAIEKVFSEGKTQPKSTYEYLDIIELIEEEIRSFDSELVSFININSFSDIVLASGIFIRNRKLD